MKIKRFTLLAIAATGVLAQTGAAPRSSDERLAVMETRLSTVEDRVSKLNDKVDNLNTQIQTLNVQLQVINTKLSLIQWIGTAIGALALATLWKVITEGKSLRDEIRQGAPFPGLPPRLKRSAKLTDDDVARFVYEYLRERSAKPGAQEQTAEHREG